MLKEGSAFGRNVSADCGWQVDYKVDNGLVLVLVRLDG